MNERWGREAEAFAPAREHEGQRGEEERHGRGGRDDERVADARYGLHMYRDGRAGEQLVAAHIGDGHGEAEVAHVQDANGGDDLRVLTRGEPVDDLRIVGAAAELVYRQRLRAADVEHGEVAVQVFKGAVAVVCDANDDGVIVHRRGFDGGGGDNCYAAGDVVSLKTTTDVGTLNGRSAGIAVDYNCYFNSEALQKQGDTVNTPAVAVGVNANDSAMLKNVSGKTKVELGSEEFARLLNDNAGAEQMAAVVAEVNAYLETLQDRGFVHNNYYTGNALLPWRVQDGMVGFFAEPAPEPEMPFDDVAEGSWYYDDVAYAFANGLMIGTGNDHFSPAVATTRGMVVTTLYCMENEPAVTGTCPFADVASGSYCENAVTWAAANGIVSGYSAAAFGPNDEITREQLATMLYEYAKYKGYDVTKAADLSGFADQGSISGFAAGPMQWAVAQELIFGVGGSAIAPKATATRAELAAVLHRFCEAFA